MFVYRTPWWVRALTQSGGHASDRQPRWLVDHPRDPVLTSPSTVHGIRRVSIDVRLPETRLAALSPEAKRRRWGWLVAALVGLLVVALIAGGLYLAHYAPLAVGGSATSGEFADDQHIDLDGDLRAYVYHDGGLIMAGLWISNTGRVPVTITGVEQSPGGWVGLITVEEPRLGAESNPASIAASQPFHPVTLGHGQDQLIDVVFRMGHCASNDVGTSMYMSDVNVFFTVLGVHRSQRLTLDPGPWVASPPSDACPHGPADRERTVWSTARGHRNPSSGPLTNSRQSAPSS
jgi:hypothetical protein